MYGDYGCNSPKRFKWWENHSLFFRIVTWIPFHIWNSFMCWFEYTLCASCPWCGRSYFVRSAKSRQKLKECCTEKKKIYGPYPGFHCGGNGGYGYGFTYDSQRDTVTDTCGRTYTRDN